MTSTPVTRAASRDYWTRPDVVRACKTLDYSLILFSLAAFMLLGSLFN